MVQLVLSAKRAVNRVICVAQKDDCRCADEVVDACQELKKDLDMLFDEYNKVYDDYENPDPDKIRRIVSSTKKVYDRRDIPDLITQYEQEGTHPNADARTYMHSGGEGNVTVTKSGNN